jgi:hypothetical protein
MGKETLKIFIPVLGKTIKKLINVSMFIYIISFSLNNSEYEDPELRL